MKKSAKKAVTDFRKKYSVTNVSEVSLADALKKQGYTIVYFNEIYNDEDVSNLIDSLQLNNYIASCKGFTYVNDKYRLVFVHEDLSSEEKLLVLAHEEGHIFCEHFSNQNIIGKEVTDEYQANEFAHYLLNPNFTQKLSTILSLHKKAVAVLCSIVVVMAVLLSVFSIISKNKSYYGDYYITDSGQKYHEADCIFVKNKNNKHRMTKEEFESGEYKPCEICLPDN